MANSAKFLFRVSGEHALFTNPATKAERATYPVLTPAAATGVIEAVYWKPEMSYDITRIFVEKPIRYMHLTRSETVKAPREGLNILDDANRIMRSSTVLCDVSYVVEAVVQAPTWDLRMKHLDIITRRLKNGQFYNPPYLGCSEMLAHVEWVDSVEDVRTVPVTMHLGTMFRRREWGPRNPVTKRSSEVKKLHFFEATLHNGVLDVEAA
jgi:CRISPR-associated protein Cas5d